MRNLFTLSLALGIASFAAAQNQPNLHPIQMQGKLDKGAWSKTALRGPSNAPQGARISGPFHVSTTTAVDRQNVILGTLNPSLEGFEEPVEPRYTIKPTDKVATPTQVNLFAGNDASSLITSYDGISQTSLTPPDTEGASGFDHNVHMVNSRFAIYDKCGTQEFAINLANFVGAPYNSYFIFDPKIIFDPWGNRWVMMMHARDSGSQDSVMLIWVSDDANPHGSWWYYAINMNWTSGANRTWADYYDLGYGVNGVYFAGNQYTYGNSYTFSTMTTLQKSQIYAAAAPGVGYRLLSDFSPRVADMYVSASPDVYLIASGSGGGNSMAVLSVTDPFGANVYNRTVVGTNAYTVAPGASTIGFGFDCRLMDARYTLDFTRGIRHLYTAMNADVGGEMGTHVVDIDPVPMTQTNYTTWWYGGGWDMAMACPNPDYDGNMSLVYSVGGPGVFPRTDTLVTDNNVYLGFYTLANGESANGSGRWGDYAGGSMDWGDYYAWPGTGGKTRIWGVGERMGPGGNWATRMGAVVGEAVVPGTLAISGGDYVHYNGVGSGSGYSQSWTLSNSGQVGLEWEVTDNVGWLDVTSAARGALYITSGGSQTYDVTTQTNANANALPYGYHAATVSFRNCLNGATLTRTVALSLGQWICPDQYAFWGGGSEFSGGLPEVCTTDGVPFSLFNDEFSLTTDLYFRFSGLLDMNGFVYSYPRYEVLRPGLSIAVYMWASDGGGWIAVAGGVASTVYDYMYGSQSGERYIHPSGWAWVRIATNPINDEDPSQDGWLTNLDWVPFWHYPQP